MASGMALDAEGRLVVCEQGTRWESAAITRVDRVTGSVETLVDEWLGDGLAVDAIGRIYVSAVDGVRLFDPAGERVGTIAVPGAVNVTFGGPDGNVLYITADDAIWAAVVETTGGSN